MTIAFVAGTACAPGALGGMDGSINSTGADFISFTLDYYNGFAGSFTNVHDNMGNTYTQLTPQTGTISHLSIFHADNPTVGASHTFTIQGTGSPFYPSGSVAAFSGVSTSSPFDVQNGATIGSGSTSLQPGSITPTQAGCVVISGVALTDNTTGTAAASGMIIISQSPWTLGIQEGIASAYVIQTSAAAINPVWNGWSGSTQDMAAVIADFKPSGTPPPPVNSNVPRLLLKGVG